MVSTIVPSLAERRPAHPPSLGHRWAVALGRSFRSHWWLAGLVGIEVAAGAVVAGMIHAASGSAFVLYLPIYILLMPIMTLLLVLGRLAYIVVVVHPARPLTDFFRELRQKFLTVERIAAALPVLLLMPFFCGAFTLVKSSITLFNPFGWDARFEALDRWLHGGYAPWALLQPLLGTPEISHWLNIFYNLWFFIVSFVWVWQAFSLRDPALRAQFFASLLLVWMIFGNLLAAVFSSAGPCYFGRVTGLPDPFAPLMDYLHAANEVSRVWALTVQDGLWAGYAESAIGLGSGISAMPSMHVAMAVLLALLFWRTNRLLGIFGWLYALIIQIGSVHLGWHYAIDGYLGAAGTLAVWFAVGRLARSGYAARLPAPLAAAGPAPARG